MQPHSMCVVSLVGLMWNAYNPRKVNSCQLRVEYTKQGSYAFHEYSLSNITESADQRELSVNIMRSSGGLSCKVTARRSSLQEGSEITLSHDTIHVAGLREVFNMYRFRIANGMSYNSMLYKGFSGDFQTDDYKKLVLSCEVKNRDDVFVPVRYEIERVTMA